MWTLIKDAFGILSFFKTRVFVIGCTQPGGGEIIIQLERYRLIKMAFTAKPYDECKEELREI